MKLAEFGAASLPIALGVALVMIRMANSEPLGRAGEPLVSLAFGAVCALPGMLALIASRRRPALYLAAGLLAGLFGFISVVALPLLAAAAAMSIVAYGRHAGEARGRTADLVAAIVCWVLGIACFVGPFLVHQDPRCVVTANSTSCSGDVVTGIEAGIALAGVGLTLLTGWALSRPTDNDG
jgi:hypothetical protein